MTTTSPDTAQATLEAIAREVVAGGLVRMAEYINGPDPDIEVVTKIVNSKAADIGKTVPEKKVDPMANLPMFNITFVNGAMQGMPGAQLAELVLDINESGEPLRLTDLEPTPAMLAVAHIVQSDVEAL